jgi:anti-sigma factor RsiW
MTHITSAALQAYLAGEIDLAKQAALEEHLIACPLCTGHLTQIATDDAHLRTALELDPEELAWAQRLDLTKLVLERVIPWYRQPSYWLILLPLLLGAAWGIEQIGSLLASYLAYKGTVGLTVTLLEVAARGGWTLLTFLSGGGLLVSLWPALVLGALLWVRYARKLRGRRPA